MAQFHFLQGTQTNYNNLIKDFYTFYFCIDTKNFYLGEIQLNNEDLTEILDRLENIENDLKNKIDSVEITSGSENGTIALIVDGVTYDNIHVTGLGSAAYTAISDYATATQGQLAEGAMPKSGGVFTGSVILNNDPVTDLEAATKEYVDNKMKASNAMVFKGTLGTDGNVTEVPTTDVMIGDTYKIITAGIWAGYNCTVGDLLIALVSGDIIANTTNWAYIPSGNEDITTLKYSTTETNLTTSAQTGDIVLAEGATKQIDNSINEELNSSNIPTSQAVVDFIENKHYTGNEGTITEITTTSPLSGGGNNGLVNLTHDISAVSSGEYGSAINISSNTKVNFNIPIITVDNYGHIINANNQAIILSYNNFVPQWKNIEDDFKLFDDFTCEDVATIVQSGLAEQYWSIGDTTNLITLNGSLGDYLTFDNYECRATIIDFDHNKDLETNGKHSMTLQFGIDETDGVDIAFIDSIYNVNSPNYNCLNMNLTSTNIGGWESSRMRNDICPQFLELLPIGLQNIIGTTTKYTDNVGGDAGSIESNITATQDKIFLLSHYELGGTACTNSYEANYIEPYTKKYNKNTDRIRYGHSRTQSSCIWWCRSPYLNSNEIFCCISINGITNLGVSASYSLGFSPVINIF